MDLLNAVNHALLPAPNLSVTQATFGQINASNQANYPRRIEIALRFLF